MYDLLFVPSLSTRSLAFLITIEKKLRVSKVAVLDAYITWELRTTTMLRVLHPPSGSRRHYTRSQNDAGNNGLFVLTGYLEWSVRSCLVFLNRVDRDLQQWYAHLPSKHWTLKGGGVPRIRRGSVRARYHGVSHSANKRAHQASTVQEHAGLRVDWSGLGVSACSSY